MPGENVPFRAEPLGMLRVPLLPRTAAAESRAAIDPRDRDQVARYLDALTSDARVEEALAVSSPSLHRAVETLRGGAPMRPNALRKLTLSATRYVLRAASRATPFGLLAGVAPVSFGDGCRVRMGTRHRKAVRPDGGWLLGVLATWEGDMDVLRGLRVVTNDLGFARGRRWVLPFADAVEDPTDSARHDSAGHDSARQDASERQHEGHGVQEVSVRHTAPVRTVLAMAHRPVLAGELLQHLDDAYPGVRASAKEGLVLGLVRLGFLLTELRPPLSETDPLRYAIDALNAAGRADEAGRLASVGDLLEQYGAQHAGAGLGHWRTVLDTMGALRTGDRSIQVDTRLDAEVTLPREVLREAERAAAALRLAAPDAAGQWAELREYRDAFVERYGTGRAVPLSDVLDPHTGLGPPAGYDHPRSERRQPARGEASERGRSRDALLAELALGAVASGAREVVLDDAVLDRLAGSRTPPAAALDLCLHLTAPSQQAVEEGDFTLVISPTTASLSLGDLFGRFAYLLDDVDALGGLVRRAATDAAGDGACPAQLDFTPRGGRSTNVVRVPSFWSERVAVGRFADRSSGAVRGMGDLALAADLDQLYVVDASTGQEIVPQFPTMLNPHLAPAAVRLLREVPKMGTAVQGLWSWGELGRLPCLPRVRYGRSVLAPARWQLSATDLADSSLPDEEWGRRLDAWRARWNVPDRVVVGSTDRRTELDLTAPLHRMLLRRELGRGAPVAAYETPEDAGAGDGWLATDAGAFTSELVLPLLPAPSPATPPSPTAAQPSATPRPPAAGPRTPRFSPVAPPAPRHSRAWLYGRLYAAAARHNEILTEQLPRLLAALPPGVDRWFFIRYSDLTGAHLRLRFHGDPDTLHGELTPGVLDWVEQLRGMRLAGAFVLDGYEPEAHRYGGHEALEAAEEVFHRDSAAVLEQLLLRATDAVTVEPAVLAAANYLDLSRQVHGDQWPDWHLTRPRDEENHAYFRDHRAAALHLLDDGGIRAAFPAGKADAVLAACAARAAAMRAYASVAREPSVLASVFHMHHNRLVGTSRTSENRSLAVARGLAQAEHGRRKHLR
ncbi:lantibiotic dehydratase [Streptomyces sp. NPDC048665]|uniref:lantibiotic dehydratase n=1 Tax=Streptomyces sp. NPDC048665 TaxID=3155490 RepID=UPI00343856AD